MRQPSDRRALWAKWEARIAGDPVAFDPQEPECGQFKAKRRGQWAAVQIDIERDIDPDTGELEGDERIVAFVNGEKFTGEKVYDIWLRCCMRPISTPEFRRLMNLPERIDLTRSVIT